MRTIVGNLQQLGYSSFANITITFELVNKFGKKISLQNELMNMTPSNIFSCNSNNDGDFFCELFENGNINRETFYKTTIADNESFNIYIPKGNSSVNILCLMNRIDYDGILVITDNITGDKYTFNERFIQKLNEYFIDNTIELTRSESKFINKYLALAQIPQDQRCEDIKALDQYLSTLGVS